MKVQEMRGKSGKLKVESRNVEEEDSSPTLDLRLFIFSISAF
jgi:hypothetical protein